MAKPIKEWGVVKFLRDKGIDAADQVKDVILKGESPIKAAADFIFGEGSDLPVHDKEMIMQKAEQDFEKWKLSVEDRQNARELYKHDNQMQKVFAYGFGGAYILVTLTMIWMAWNLATADVELNEFFITIISTVFGAMSSKVNTIADFLFGTSLNKDKIDNKIFE